jgi:hypothetical protein
LRKARKEVIRGQRQICKTPEYRKHSPEKRRESYFDFGIERKKMRNKLVLAERSHG